MRASIMLNWELVLRYAQTENPTADNRVELTEQEWQQKLTPEQFQVARKKGTERPFSGELCEMFELGKYACVCCDTLLFDASEKFDSGTGWPSFTSPVKDNVVAYVMDNSLARVRIEAVCNVCDAHLGHVFEDGPKPTGLRYCMNSVALKKL